jgi:hypothetical protein
MGAYEITLLSVCLCVPLFVHLSVCVSLPNLLDFWSLRDHLTVCESVPNFETYEIALLFVCVYPPEFFLFLWGPCRIKDTY